MPGHDIVVIGASAGGLEVLREIAQTLPRDFPGAVFIVLHIPPNATSVLPAILGRRSRLKATHAVDGEAIEPGRIYVAPPDRHLLVKRGRVRVMTGPRENGHRPAADPLFRSAAAAYGPRVVGVVLSGTLDDGTAGLRAVTRRGGVAVVQDLDDALYDGMPRSALDHVEVDHVVPGAEIGPLLDRLAREPVADLETPPDEEAGAEEMDMVEVPTELIDEGRRNGRPSVYTCPECHGTLWAVAEDGVDRFRCRVGHGYSPETLLDQQRVSFEAALWAALRALEENASLTRRMEERARGRGVASLAKRFGAQAEVIERRAALVRSALRGETGRLADRSANGGEPDDGEREGAVRAAEDTSLAPPADIA